MMQVRVLLFSILREKTGTALMAMSLPESSTAKDLLDELERQHPSVSAYRRVVRVAINEEYAPVDSPLQEGDEIALITPVSGG